MPARPKAYLIAEAVCLIVVLLWALSAFGCTHPLYGNAGADSSIFLCGEHFHERHIFIKNKEVGR